MLKNTPTHSEAPLSFLDSPAAVRDLLGLVVIWSRDEPERVGEVLLVPVEHPGKHWSLGRGEYGAGEWLDRLKLFRQRPGQLDPVGTLQCPRISRSQLSVMVRDRQALVVANTGRCALLVNGVEQTEGLIQPGDTLELKNELTLLCVRRPSIMRALPEVLQYPPFLFGQADAFGMVGESPGIWELRRQLAVVARQATHVLLLGESGTGKELAARALHACSPRASHEMVARNAATFPEGLIDAELFGNMKNYPNPGMPERPGLVGQADGSSLFLDEFAELPVSQQAHLLRVMDEGEYQRLGETRARRADFRLIAATNRPERFVKHDVLARLKTQIQLPDLNSRREDIPLLIRHLLRRHAGRDAETAERFFRDANALHAPRLAPALVRVLVQHRYQTHIRELEQLLLIAIFESRGRFLELTEGVCRKLAIPPHQGAEPSPARRATGIPDPTSAKGVWDDEGNLPFHPEEVVREQPARSETSQQPHVAAAGDRIELPEAPQAAGIDSHQTPATENREGSIAWKELLKTELSRLLSRVPDSSPSYDALNLLAERLKAAYIGSVLTTYEGKLLAAARQLECNRDVIRRYQQLLQHDD